MQLRGLVITATKCFWRRKTTQQTKKIINTLRPWSVEMNPSPRLGFLRGVFLANHLLSTETLTSNNRDRTHTNIN